MFSVCLIYTLEYVSKISSKGVKVAYIDGSKLRYLREINLIMGLRITQTIFIPVWNPIVHAYSFQLLNITIEPHFKVDADSAIQGRLWTVYVDVRNPGFDNLRENGLWLFRILCVGHSHLDWVASIESLSNCGW